jgi:hypothetical protein
MNIAVPTSRGGNVNNNTLANVIESIVAVGMDMPDSSDAPIAALLVARVLDFSLQLLHANVHALEDSMDKVMFKHKEALLGFVGPSNISSNS